MKIIKKAVLASALLLAFQQGAMATETSVATPPTFVNNTAEFVQSVSLSQEISAQSFQISQEELAAAFESATPEQKMQMAALSGQEMKETEGAFWWFFVPLVVRATPAIISYAAGTGGTFMIPTWYGRIRLWW